MNNQETNHQTPAQQQVELALQALKVVKGFTTSQPSPELLAMQQELQEQLTSIIKNKSQARKTQFRGFNSSEEDA